MNYKQVILEQLKQALSTFPFKVLTSKLDINTYVIMVNDRNRDNVSYTIGCEDERCGWKDIKFTAKYQGAEAVYTFNISGNEGQVLEHVNFAFNSNDQHLAKIVDQHIKEVANMLYKILLKDNSPSLLELQPVVKHFTTLQKYVETNAK